MGILESVKPKDLHEAAQALEALMLRQVLQSSGVFHGTDGLAGSEMRSDLFVDALADAVAKSGGIGLTQQLERSLGGGIDPLAGTAPDASRARSPSGRDVASAGLSLPVGGFVSSHFGERTDPLNGRRVQHHGIDIAAAEGSKITVAASGVVLHAGERGSYGLAVEVEHDDGSTTFYAHASELLVGTGDRVEHGQEIARVGHTGRATGPHLHFELRQEGRAVDPSPALKLYRARADSFP